VHISLSKTNTLATDLMATALDMSLDDLIKNRGSRERVRGRGRVRRGRGPGRAPGGGRMPGPFRRGPLAVNPRPSPYAIAKASSKLWMSIHMLENLTCLNNPNTRVCDGSSCNVGNSLVQDFSSYPVHGVFAKELPSLNLRTGALNLISAPSVRRTRNFPWQHDLFEESLRAAGIPGIEIGTKLYVSNLDSGVTNEDIRELFAEIGDLKRYAVHYDKNGRQSSLATDFLHISGTSCSQSRRGGARGGRARGRGRGRGQGQGQGRGRGQVQGQGQGRGREKNQAVEMSVDELNDDLDNYHAGAKHI
ncbi:tho complex subunit 4c, partial [Quercus suber]